MDQQDWKTASVVASARHHVASHFLRCLRLIHARKMEEARLCLTRGSWRTGLDLTGVPPDVLDRTDALCSRTRGLLDYGDPDAIAGLVDEIVGLWS